MFVTIFSSAAVNVLVMRGNLVDLAMRRQTWHSTWMTVASKQFDQSQEDGLAYDAAQASTLFGKVSFVYRRRSFHHYMLQLMASVSTDELVIAVQAFVTVILGWEALNHTVQLSCVVSVITGMSSLKTDLDNHVKTWLDIVDGYVSVLTIAEVFDKDADIIDGSLHDVADGNECDYGKTDWLRWCRPRTVPDPRPSCKAMIELQGVTILQEA